MDGQIPKCPEAERATLGSMLRLNSSIPEVMQLVSAGDFVCFPNHLVFEAVVHLWESGQPVELVLLAEELRRRGQAGGREADVPYTYLAELWDAEPIGHNGVSYARLVRERALQRELLAAGQKITRAATDAYGPMSEIIEDAEKLIFQIADLGTAGESLPISKAMIEACLEIDSRQAGSTVGSGVVSTGFDDLDNLTGGLHASELILLAARPSTGKTALAISIIRHAVMQQQVPVFFASLEQSRIEIAERLMCQHGEVDSFRLRRPGLLRPEDVSRLAGAKDALSPAPLHIDDSPCQSVLRIGANARRHRLKHKIGLVVIDYIQLIDAENKKDNRNEQVSQISRRLKWLARELKIPVLALAQLNRSSEQRANDRPRLSDLRDSGSLEQDGDTIFLLHQPSGEDQGRIDVIVAKQRNGPKDETTLRFNKRFVRFEPFVPEYQEADANGHL